MTTPPDEITTAEAARLLNISDEMFRRVCAQGYVTRHKRGRTTVTSAVSGYASFLRASAERHEANETQARAHRAKAAKIRRETERRRAALTDRADVEQIVQTVAETAASRLRSIDLTGEVDGRTNKKLQVEIKAAFRRIEAAKASALAALRGGEVGGDE